MALVTGTEVAGVMVDRLKSATEHLEAPGCPNCQIEMNWFCSKLVADEPVSIIEHEFVCPSCARVERSRTEFVPVRVQPDKLSAPRLAAALAT